MQTEKTTPAPIITVLNEYFGNYHVTPVIDTVNALVLELINPSRIEYTEEFKHDAVFQSLELTKLLHELFTHWQDQQKQPKPKQPKALPRHYYTIKQFAEVTDRPINEKSIGRIETRLINFSKKMNLPTFEQVHPRHGIILAFHKDALSEIFDLYFSILRN